MGQPVIAAVNGVAAGAGASLAFACDVRVAAEEARFVLAFGRIGLVPDSGATWLLPRIVGPAKAAELAIVGDAVDAAEALRIGLVSRVVPGDRLLGEARALAGRVAEGAPLAMALARARSSERRRSRSTRRSTGRRSSRGSPALRPITPRVLPRSGRSGHRASRAPDDTADEAYAEAMTDPLALDPVLSPTERSGGAAPARQHDEAYEAWFARFEAHVMNGGKVEAVDPMPDEYRTAVLRFVEMHANSELMGVLPEREWLMRAPTLRRKLALTAKVQDEVGHAQLLYRVAEDLGKPREAMFDDLLAGKTKFHNVFHYPTGRLGGRRDDRLAGRCRRDRRPAGAARLELRAVRADDAQDLLGGVGPHHAWPRRRRDHGHRHAGAARRRSRTRSIAGGDR